MICNNGSETKEIDARTSDAIAMAVRFNCPIYTYEFILASSGVVLEEGSEVETPKSLPKKTSSKKSTTASSSESEYSSLSMEELKESLMRAIDEEAYETASKIRDELAKRKKPSQQ